MTIRNIIFDYGGVIIDLDYSLTKKSFENSGVDNFDAYWTQIRQTSLFDEFDRGIISPSAFRKKLNNEVCLQLSDDQIDEAWNAMLLGIKPEKWKLLEKLKKTYRTFLLSNTNEIHLQAIAQYLQKNYGVKSPAQLFEKIYYSCRVGLRKPDPAIFKLVLHENHLKAEETLYIDDTFQHVEAAGRLGFISVFYDPKEKLDEFLEQMLKG